VQEPAKGHQEPGRWEFWHSSSVSSTTLCHLCWYSSSKKKLVFLPAVYALMTSKYKTSFKKLFEHLEEKLNGTGPHYFSCDYDITVMLGVEEVFPLVEICGCLFHFAQALFQVLKNNGLQCIYNAKEEKFRLDFLALIAFSFVPVEDVELFFFDLLENIDERLDRAGNANPFSHSHHIR
jgi:hypothetical protein